MSQWQASFSKELGLSIPFDGVEVFSGKSTMTIAVGSPANIENKTVTITGKGGFG